MLISSLDSEKLTDQQVSRLLYDGVEDDGRNGECIFVAGSSKAAQYRLPKAVELYKNGRAAKMLFSGGVRWEGQDYPEALMLKHEALKYGVADGDILLEDISMHTKENVLASLLVMDRAFYLHNINRLLIVTGSYHMRRLHLTMKTYMPEWIDYSLCPVNDKWTRQDNWYKTKIGRKRAKTECEKLLHYVKMGVLVDENIRFND
ncbi:YdcF family protein [Virgibacillus siamensis]|uniref:YdcF family protein n=1 Tax=Virgibacillus siamensis TaxID=480071 RepID=UPI000987A608|nr:YdcF family protein [Virgibacillus siamensis]